MTASKLAVPALLLLSMMPATATAQDSFQTTYHVEVLVQYIGYLSPSVETGGSSTWSSEYSSTSLEEARFVLDLFETAFAFGTLEDLIGLNTDNYVITDIRLRTEYPRQLAVKVKPNQRPLLSQFTRIYFLRPY